KPVVMPAPSSTCRDDGTHLESPTARCKHSEIHGPQIHRRPRTTLVRRGARRPHGHAARPARKLQSRVAVDAGQARPGDAAGIRRTGRRAAPHSRKTRRTRSPAGGSRWWPAREAVGLALRISISWLSVPEMTQL